MWWRMAVIRLTLNHMQILSSLPHTGSRLAHIMLNVTDRRVMSHGRCNSVGESSFNERWRSGRADDPRKDSCRDRNGTPTVSAVVRYTQGRLNEWRL